MENLKIRGLRALPEASFIGASFIRPVVKPILKAVPMRLLVAALVATHGLSGCVGGSGTGVASGAPGTPGGGGGGSSSAGGGTGTSGTGTTGTGGGGSGGGAGGGSAGNGITGENPATVFPQTPTTEVPTNTDVVEQSINLSIANPSASITQRTFASFNGARNAVNGALLNITTNNISAMQIVTISGGVNLATVKLLDPSGTTLISYDEVPVQTSGVLLANDVNVLPYPARAANPAMVNGKYQHLVYLTGNSGQQYTGTAFGKNDPDFANGNLRVNIFFVGTTAQRGDVRDAVTRGLQIWRDIYAKANISLTFALFDIPSGTGVLPSPAVGSNFYNTTISSTPGVQDLAVNIFLGAVISSDGTTDTGNELDGVLGFSPAIPGPAAITTKSAVAISINEHAGVDGVLDGNDTAVLGETLAHESGHYLGLFHPVEDPTGTGQYVLGDPLDDTPLCSKESECVANGLASNMMFPRPVAGVPQQRDITAQQTQVMNLQVLVD